MNNIKILGDSNRKSRFNKNLADVVNKNVEDKLRKETEMQIKENSKKQNDFDSIFPDFSGVDDYDMLNDLDDYLILKNISCVDADGRVFEHYDKLYVAKDVIRTAEHYSNSELLYKHATFNLESSINYFTKRNTKAFLPSFALTCNILSALYNHVMFCMSNPARIALPEEANAPEYVLKQYVSHGQEHGLHLQNTVVEWPNKKIVHYPHLYPKSNIHRIEIPFEMSDLMYDNKHTFYYNATRLENTDANFSRFMKNLTGLREPDILTRIAGYMGRKAVVNTPNSSQPTTFASTEIGCDGSTRLAMYMTDENQFSAVRMVAGFSESGADK